MKVTLMNYTQDAKELLIFSKRTRHMQSVDDYNKVVNMSEEEKEEELKYVFQTIGSSWEFVDYTFLIEEVTRAFTHQLVRHRVGVSFAQQAQRVADMSDFKYLATNKCIGDKVYNDTMKVIQEGYEDMIKRNIDAQDARGVLPTNIYTNILFKVNLRSLSGILNTRLCYRAQGEFQNVARELRSLALGVHPWAEKVLQVHCLQHSSCPWESFRCPLKELYPTLLGLPEWQKPKLKEMWERLTLEVQPVVHIVEEKE